MTEHILQWLSQAGGSYDPTAIAIKDYSDQGMGMGVVAIRDIPDETTLFSIPNSLLLSSSNSSLRPLIRQEDWDTLEETGGWASLMLCMMWEEFRGEESRWNGYFKSLPNTFQTPMFWTSDETTHLLTGTDVIDKIGRGSAEGVYEGKIRGVLERYPNLFPLTTTTTTTATLTPTPIQPFSLAHFHIQGSRILSRSFSVPSSRAGRTRLASRAMDQEQEEDGEEGDVSMRTDEGRDEEVVVVGEDVRGQEKDDGKEDEDEDEPRDEHEEDDEDDEDEDDDEEGEEEVMVPMADMLNAAYERDNARLFHEEDCLRMVTTKAISKGEQIFNTYGSPSNSYLLRKYGHVDVYPLPEPILSNLPETLRTWPHGNEGDEVEISGEIVLRAAVDVWADGSRTQEEKEGRRVELAERVDWWLEEGEEDTFVLTYPPDEIPEAIIGFARLLIEEEAWEKARDKGKVPKPKIERTVGGLKVIQVLLRCIEIRREAYTYSLKDDLDLLATQDKDTMGLYPYMARVVRTGEGRVLSVAETVLSAQKKDLEQALNAGGGKRKAEGSSGQRGKKPKTRTKIA